jgi:hypothetical protein
LPDSFDHCWTVQLPIFDEIRQEGFAKPIPAADRPTRANGHSPDEVAAVPDVDDVA